MPDQEIHVSVAKELPLAAGESVNDFLDVLRREVTKWAKEKFKLGKDGYSYPRDVFEDAVIVDVHKAEKDGIRAGEYLFQVPYKRKDTAFTFGEPVQVVRRVTYVPVSKAEVSKSESFWGGVL